MVKRAGIRPVVYGARSDNLLPPYIVLTSPLPDGKTAVTYHELPKAACFEALPLLGNPFSLGFSLYHP